MAAESNPTGWAIVCEIAADLEAYTVARLKTEMLVLVSRYGIKSEEDGRKNLCTLPVKVSGVRVSTSVVLEASLNRDDESVVDFVTIRGASDFANDGRFLLMYQTDGTTSWNAAGDVDYGENGNANARVLLTILSSVRRGHILGDINPRKLSWSEPRK